MISLIVGILVMRTRSTRASATRRIPQRAKGDWGREKLGAASCCHFVRIFLYCLGVDWIVGKRTMCRSSPSINTRSDSMMTFGDLVRYTARRKRNRACP